MNTPHDTVVITVPEISCAHCKASIEGALTGLPGVEAAEVDIPGRTVRVVHAPGRVTLADLVAAIEDQGYEVPSPPGGA